MVKPAYEFNEKTLDFVERLNRMGLPRHEMARRIGVSATTLVKYMHMAGLTPVFPKLGGAIKPLPIREVAELYVCEGWSTHRLARYFGWSHTGIGKRLKAAGVVMRAGYTGPS